MWHVNLFNGLLAVSIIYALLRGGAPERIGAVILFVGCAATALLYSAIDRRFHALEVGVLIIDIAAALAFLVLLLCSTRFWPAWGCAVQVAAVVVHLLRLVPHTPFAFPYALVLALLGYPLPLILASGVRAHRLRLKTRTFDPAWRNSSAARSA